MFSLVQLIPTPYLHMINWSCSSLMSQSSGLLSAGSHYRSFTTLFVICISVWTFWVRWSVCWCHCCCRCCFKQVWKKKTSKERLPCTMCMYWSKRVSFFPLFCKRNKTKTGRNNIWAFYSEPVCKDKQEGQKKRQKQRPSSLTSLIHS